MTDDESPPLSPSAVNRLRRMRGVQIERMGEPGIPGASRIGALLRTQWETFAVEMACGECSASEAYASAYPKSRAWKQQTRASRASELMQRPEVRARVVQLRGMLTDEVRERAVLTKLDVLEETRRLMLATPKKLIDPVTGKIRLPHELDDETAAAIASFEIDDLGRVKYKFWDKNSALERAAKILGLMREGATIVNNGTMNITKIELVALEPLEAPPAAGDVVDLVEMDGSGDE